MKGPFLKKEKPGYSVRLNGLLYDSQVLKERESFLAAQGITVQKKNGFLVFRIMKDDIKVILDALNQYFLWVRNG